MVIRKTGREQRFAQEEFDNLLFDRVISRHVSRLLFVGLIITRACANLSQRQDLLVFVAGTVLFLFCSIENMLQGRREAELRDLVAKREDVSDDYIRYRYKYKDSYLRRVSYLICNIEPFLWLGLLFAQGILRGGPSR
jgi:hypothetical protein